MRICLIFLLLVPLALPAQLIRIVNLKTNQLTYSGATGKVYATVPSTAGSNGNSIAVIEPTTASLDTTVFIGSEPNALDISDDGSTIWAGLDGAPNVIQFFTNTLTTGISLNLGSTPLSGLRFADDIAVLPGTTDEVAVSRRNQGFSPRHEGVALFVSGAEQPLSTQSHTGSNVIEAISPSLLYGYNNETTEFGLRTITAGSNGLTESQVYNNFVSGFDTDIAYSQGRLYATNGKVVDVSGSAPQVTGTFANVNGPVTADTNSNLVVYATGDFFATNVEVYRFSPTTFLPFDTIVVPPTLASGAVRSIVPWGNSGGLALNTEDVVIIIDPNLVATDPTWLREPARLAPNPTQTDVRLTWGSRNQADQIRIFAADGRLVQQIDRPVLPYILPAERLAQGIYHVVVSAEESTSAVKMVRQ